jgi:hypothetical protein
MTMTPEKQLRILARDVFPLLKSVVAAFTPDPGTSDLDDDQPLTITIPLGEYRRAARLKHELEKLP